tara:strand:- start:23 stop:229 length:207 start_codon:yes stop_codon:yes gene_type:complete
MRIGDLVITRHEPRRDEEKEIGIVVSKNSIFYDEDDITVFWPTAGLAKHLKSTLEIISKVRKKAGETS